MRSVLPEQMHAATKAHFEAFCKLRKRMRDQNTVQLFQMSARFEQCQFTQMTLRLLKEVPVQTRSSRKKLQQKASSSSSDGSPVEPK